MTDVSRRCFVYIIVNARIDWRRGAALSLSGKMTAACVFVQRVRLDLERLSAMRSVLIFAYETCKQMLHDRRPFAKTSSVYALPLQNFVYIRAH